MIPKIIHYVWLGDKELPEPDRTFDGDALPMLSYEKPVSVLRFRQKVLVLARVVK